MTKVHKKHATSAFPWSLMQLFFFKLSPIYQFKVKKWKKNALHTEPGPLFAPVAQIGLYHPSSTGAPGMEASVFTSPSHSAGDELWKAQNQPWRLCKGKGAFLEAQDLDQELMCTTQKSPKVVGISPRNNSRQQCFCCGYLGALRSPLHLVLFSMGYTEAAAPESMAPPVASCQVGSSTGASARLTPSGEGPMNRPHTTAPMGKAELTPPPLPTWSPS